MRSGNPFFAAQEQRMRAKFPYLVSKASVCPRVVAGKRCLVGYAFGRECVCQRARHLGVIDHARMWLDMERRHVLTSEPYAEAFDEEDLVKFRAMMAELGLTVTTEDWSAWNPGACTLITVARRVIPPVDE